MEKLLFITGLLFLFASCGEQNSSPSNAQMLDLTGFSIQELAGGYQNVLRKGTDGKMVEEGVLKDGKRNGAWVVYHDRRPLPKSVANFVDDQYSGVYLEYSATGQLELICRYNANQLTGQFTKYKNTRVLEEGTYVDGQIDGKHLKYYPNKDVVQQETNYKLGQLHGASKCYNEEGQLIMEYEYKDGEKISGGVVEPTGGENEQ